jgi:sensor histidine kinase YesM
MNPFLSNIRAVSITSLLWLLLGALFAVLLNFAHLSALQNALWFSIPVCLVFGFISASAYYVCRSLPMQKRQFFLVLSLFGGASLFAGSIWLLLSFFWNRFCISMGYPNLGLVLSEQLIPLIFITGTLLYLLSILAYDVLIAFENIRSSELRQAASEVYARDAELQVLRTQINPHFLFNSLNSISALTTIDAAGARAMTIELAQFFRQTLALSEKQKICLADEIALCEHFLSIEKIRFGKKLQVQMEIETASQAALIPPMILQPLLENAIKHGIRDLVDGGTILIKSMVRDEWLFIAIENPIDVQPSQAQGTGTGLKNLQARLSSLYGKRSRVDWQNKQQIFRVEITIPFEINIQHELLSSSN